MSMYAVVDLEMCRVNSENMPGGCHLRQEIIQFGAVILDEKFNVREKYMSFVSPAFGAVDNFIEKLTGIRQSDLTGAPDLETVLRDFTSRLPEETAFVAWSDSDEIQLRNETFIKGIENEALEKLLSDCIDCQAVFGEKMESSRNYNLTEALSIAGIEYQNGAHDALVDAYNTALLFKKLRTEKKFRPSSWFHKEEEVLCFTSNPFAELLKNYA